MWPRIPQLYPVATICAGLSFLGPLHAGENVASPKSVPHDTQAAQEKAQAAESFDPLAHDNTYDTLFRDDVFTLRGVIGTYTAEPPQDPLERISFCLANIDRTTEAFYSPDGYSISPVSLAILRMGDWVRPWVRQAFTHTAAKPAEYRKARFLACVAGRLHDDEAFDALAVATLQHPSPDVRAGSCWALARCGGPRAIPFLVELLYMSKTLGDTEALPLGAAEALSAVTGRSFPKITTSEERPGVAVVWQDPARWREWANRYRADGHARYKPAVENALQARRAHRLDGKSGS